MSDNSPQLSPAKQALLKIRQLKQQLAKAETGAAQPIAIVSMACRFPRTADTPEKFWQSLIRQDNLVSEIPDDRWDMDAFHDDDPDVPGKMYARKGVFLDDIASMDPEFFGISPREATWVDPQQRLLMEVGWEAIERAGWIPEQISERTGVFVGWMHNDYQNEASDSFLNLNPYIATGAAGSFLCGRLAYYLGLRGPSIAVDTACSSSLVALHLAIQSLQRKECDRALVGGVNAICSPTTNILTCKLKALSPSGHSRAFDAAADGYLRGEGCGVVTLRRLSDAEKDGDQILGIIRGSAVGHNGAGGGLTVPNPKAQEKVIRQAIQQAGLEPHDIDYLEAHGTGTSLGDPIEVNAAAAAYCENRSADKPLLIGSVKTNIGHLEAAAGMAGLIKVLLSLQNGTIPGQMNFETPNPHIAWDKIPVKVLTQETNWPDSQHRFAGVSAFGMSGTNAHVILQAPDMASNEGNETPTPSQTRIPSIVTLSAKTESAALDLAAACVETMSQHSDTPIADIAYQSNVSRSHFPHRVAVVANDTTQAVSGLRSVGRGTTSNDVFRGGQRRQPVVAWQFTGQGAQYHGMGRQLYECQPVYREAIDHCDRVLKNVRSGSLLDVLFGDARQPLDIDNTHWTQPAIFALQMGLAKLLTSWNIRPDIVLGHSVGQYAAACVAGIMTWDDGLTLIAERGRLIGALPENGPDSGLMIAAFAPQAAIATELSSQPDVSLAAKNGTHVVLSGKADAVQRIQNALDQRGIKTKALTTSHAFHSSLMDPVLKPFAAFANTVDFQPARLPLICNVTGATVPANEILKGDYWAQHIRQPVAFDSSIQTLNEMNCDVLVELGPRAVLTRMAAATWQKPDGRISCLEHETDDNLSIARSVANLYVHGVTPNFKKWNGDRISKTMVQMNRTGSLVQLPTYPFQRRRFWGPAKPRAAHAEFHTAHPLLGSKIALAGTENESRYESFIDVDSPSWIVDHEVMNGVVLPGAALVEMAIEHAAGKTITNALFEQPIRPTGRTALQTVIRKPADGKNEKLEVFARRADDANWVRHFSCEIDSTAETQKSPGGEPIVDLTSIAESLPETDSPENFYRHMNDLGLNYGPAFRCIEELRYSETDVLTRLQLHGDVPGYNVTPTILDAALHSLAAGLLRSDDDDLFLPVGMGRVQMHQTVGPEAWCHARWKQSEGKTRVADIKIVDANGRALVLIDDLKVQQVSLSAMRQISGAGAERLVHDFQWKTTRLAPATLEPKTWLVIEVGNTNPVDDALAQAISQRLTDQGHVVHTLSLGEKSPFDAGQVKGWNTWFEKNLAEPDSATLTSPPFDGVIWCVPHTDSTHSNQTNTPILDPRVQSLVAFVQTMLKRQWRKLPCGLLLVTRNAMAIDSSATVNPETTQMWGLGRVLSAEQPELRCRLLDLDSPNLDSQSLFDLATAIATTETADSQYLIRNEQTFVPRMQRTRLPKSGSFAADPNGCYLITGGLGMLGREAAGWLAERGAGQIVLVSRREPDDDAMNFIQSLQDDDCQVVVHSADMSNRADVEALFKRFRPESTSSADLAPLRGIIHAAGVLDDGLIESQTPDRFEKVLKPKVAAARLLDQLSRQLDLHLFVLYSSAASVLGSPGQSNYAAGNAYLDGLAAQRRAAGQPGLAINWGPWTKGMADDERILKQLALQGITPLAVSQAHAAMEKMIVNNITQATVMDVDWRRMRIGPTGDVPTILQDLVGGKRKSKSETSALVNRLRTLNGKAQRDLLMQTLRESLQRILSTAQPPETDRPLIEMGLDSLMAVEFGTELHQMLGDQFNIGPTMLFDHPTIDAICDHILELVTAGDQAGQGTNEQTASKIKIISQQKQQTARDDIAIIGMSCRFPGAENIDQFWQNLLNGTDSVCDIPHDRWDIDRFYNPDRQPGKMYTRRGGFLNDIAEFDAAFFNISEQEACWIDPQHRMLLENSYRALEDAGIPVTPMADPNVGVFMGIMGSDYAFLPTLDDEQIIKGFQGAGLSHSAGVGRISYLFGFEGPSVAIDTASSSSLVAVYQAMRSLQEGNCNLALAGGANAILAPVNSLLMSSAGLLSSDGRCKSFSKSADGFGRGEGCGIVVLKRLDDARRDGDRIMAVLRGGAVVHNGFSGGITSPSGKAQARVIDAAIKDAGIAPSQVQYLEAHGTGTEYGDPMELGAAAKIYGKGRKRDQPLLVGSVKANISHLEAAGGASGLIKTVLSLYHRQLPGQIHFQEPSPHVPWKRMPVQVVDENRTWPDCDRPTAGITALGLVGTNAHLILSAAETAPETPAPPGDQSTVSETRHLMVVSARCRNALQQLCRQYARFLKRNPNTDMGDFCYTLATGRKHYEHRLAMTVGSRHDAIEQLADVAANANVVKASQRFAWLFGNQTDRETVRNRLRQLVTRFKVVATFVDECDARLKTHLTKSMDPSSFNSLRELIGSIGQSETHGKANASPSNSKNGSPDAGDDHRQLLQFVYQASLCRLWQSWGILPDRVAGFAVGQYTAACVAGCLDFLDAVILVFEHERLQNGNADSEQGEQFESLADQFNFYPPNLPLVCCHSGQVVPIHRSLGGSYWRQHMEQNSGGTTAFDQPLTATTIQSLLDDDVSACMIAGPHDKNVLKTLRSHCSEMEITMMEMDGPSPDGSPGTAGPVESLGQLYTLGGTPDFSAVSIDSNHSPRRIGLPTYPFQKKRYWITEIAQYMNRDETPEVESTLS